MSAIAAFPMGILISTAIVQRKLLVLAAIVVVGLACVWPVEMAIGIFTVLIPFEQVLALGNSGTTINWVAGAFAGATLVLYGFASGRFQSPPRAAFYWGLFVLWTVASTTWAIEPDTSLKWLATGPTLFAFYIVAVSIRVTRRQLSRICLLIVVGGVVAASLIIFQFAHHISFEGRASLVVGELQANPNALAFTLLLPFSLALRALASDVGGLKRTALLASLTLTAISILLTMSRGSLIALAAITLVYLFRAGVGKRVLLPISILAIPLFFLPNLFYQRLERAANDRGTGRYDIWLAGLEIVKRNPIFGTGLANFPVAYRSVSGYAHVFPLRGYTRDAHNTYLQVCAEMGLIGFGLFIAAIWSQMATAHRHLSNRHPRDYLGIAIEAACWGQLMMGLSGNIEWSKSFWLAFTLLALAGQERTEAVPLAFRLPIEQSKNWDPRPNAWRNRWRTI